MLINLCLNVIGKDKFGVEYVLYNSNLSLLASSFQVPLA